MRRAVEWFVRFMCCRRLQITCGPLQIANGPWLLRTAIGMAARRLDGLCLAEDPRDADLTLIARNWHGASVRQPGAEFGYEDALRLGLAVIDEHWTVG